MQEPSPTGGQTKPTPTLILGVGNLLVGDEGVGIHAVRLLEKESWPPHVSLLDGGTGGFHLLEVFRTSPRIILIDATLDGKPAGTVKSFDARVPADFPSSLGAHDIGLRDLLWTAALMGPLPRIHVITISIHTLNPMCLDLSPEVAASLPEVISRVRSLIVSES